MNITKEQMLSTIAYYYEKEYAECERYLKNYNRAQARDVETYINRCLGVAFFAQELDIPFNDVDLLYNSIRERFEKLRENFLNN